MGMMNNLRLKDLRDPDDPRRVQKHFLYVDLESGELTADEGMTRQEFKDDCDINVIAGNILRTGDMGYLERYEKWLGDKAEAVAPDLDYKKALDTILDAEQSFDALPSGVRSVFDNDPEKFLHYVNTKGMDEVRELIKAKTARRSKKVVAEEDSSDSDKTVPKDTAPSEEN